jgi:SAM-dependent methyltransferase
MSETSQNYDDSYYQANDQDSDRIALGWYSRLIRKHAVEGSTALDYGCGTGYFVRRLSKYFQVAGFDTSQAALEKASSLVPNASFFNSASLIPDGSFDLVTSLHVLEHIENPSTAFSDIFRILTDNGVALIVVPDTAGRGHALKGQEWFAYKDATHCTFLPSADWVALARDAGFDVLIEGSDGLWDSPYSKRLPRQFDRLIFGWPLIARVLTSTLNSRPNRGECAVLILKKHSN